MTKDKDKIDQDELNRIIKLFDRRNSKLQLKRKNILSEELQNESIIRELKEGGMTLFDKFKSNDMDPDSLDLDLYGEISKVLIETYRDQLQDDEMKRMLHFDGDHYGVFQFTEAKETYKIRNKKDDEDDKFTIEWSYKIRVDLLRPWVSIRPKMNILFLGNSRLIDPKVLSPFLKKSNLLDLYAYINDFKKLKFNDKSKASMIADTTALVTMIGFIEDEEEALSLRKEVNRILIAHSRKTTKLDQLKRLVPTDQANMIIKRSCAINDDNYQLKLVIFETTFESLLEEKAVAIKKNLEKIIQPLERPRIDILKPVISIGATDIKVTKTDDFDGDIKGLLTLNELRRVVKQVIHDSWNRIETMVRWNETDQSDEDGTEHQL